MVSFFKIEQGVFEVHVSLVQNLELLPLARIMMQLAHVQIRKEPKVDFKNFSHMEISTFSVVLVAKFYWWFHDGDRLKMLVTESKCRQLLVVLVISSKY